MALRAPAPSPPVRALRRRARPVRPARAGRTATPAACFHGRPERLCAELSPLLPRRIIAACSRCVGPRPPDDYNKGRAGRRDSCIAPAGPVAPVGGSELDAAAGERGWLRPTRNAPSRGQSQN